MGLRGLRPWSYRRQSIDRPEVSPLGGLAHGPLDYVAVTVGDSGPVFVRNSVAHLAHFFLRPRRANETASPSVLVYVESEVKSVSCSSRSPRVPGLKEAKDVGGAETGKIVRSEEAGSRESHSLPGN